MCCANLISMFSSAQILNSLIMHALLRISYGRMLPTASYCAAAPSPAILEDHRCAFPLGSSGCTRKFGMMLARGDTGVRGTPPVHMGVSIRCAVAPNNKPENPSHKDLRDRELKILTVDTASFTIARIRHDAAGSLAASA